MPIFERCDYSPVWNQLCPEWYLDPDAPQPERRWLLRAAKSEIRCDETTRITARLFDHGRPVVGEVVKLLIQRDFHAPEEREAVSTEEGIAIEVSLEKPGFIRVVATAADGVTGAIGVGAEVRRILPVPEIAGFDAYWEKQRARLRAVPPTLLHSEELQFPDYPRTVSFDLRIQSVGEPVSGILSLPENAAPGSLPAYLFVHGAGIRPAFPPTPWAKNGFLALNISALALRYNQSPEYYEEKNREFNDYAAFRSADPEEIHFNDMALRVLRALEYLKSRPEWNRQTLVIHGGSQGGWQSLVGAAFDHDVTFAQIEAPAMCNLAGALEGRTPSWPNTVRKEFGDTPKTRAAQLFDGVAFARRCQAPAVFTVGYSDGAATPSSIYAAYRVYGGAVKNLWCFTDLGHEGAVFWSGEKNILEHAGR